MVDTSSYATAQLALRMVKALLKVVKGFDCLRCEKQEKKIQG